MEAENTHRDVSKTDGQEQLDLNVLNQEQSNQLPTPEEARCFSEAFYEEQALRLKEFFPGMYDTNHLRMLQRQLNRMKIVMEKLKLPWDEYIPMMHNAFMLNYSRIEGHDAKAHTLRLTTKLISTATYLSQNGRLINEMSSFFHQQIVELEKMMEERKERTD